MAGASSHHQSLKNTFTFAVPATKPKYRLLPQRSPIQSCAQPLRRWAAFVLFLLLFFFFKSPAVSQQPVTLATQPRRNFPRERLVGRCRRGERPGGADRGAAVPRAASGAAPSLSAAIPRPRFRSPSRHGAVYPWPPPPRACCC